MKVGEIQGSFGLENLKINDRNMGQPGPGQILVNVKACSLNYRDLMTVKGLYNPKQKLPLIPLSDGAGEVAAVGAGVTRVSVGDRVASIFAQGWLSGEPDFAARGSTLGGPHDGMLAEQVLLSEQGVVKFPQHLSFEEAATLPCAAVTAWNAINVQGDVRSGDVVLVQGTGGVSLFALQFAKMAGARVIITSSSDEKLDKARRLGADETINYRQVPDWEKKVMELTGRRGVDNIVEVGGAGTLGKAISCVRIGGQISIIGVLSGPTTDFDVRPILMKGVTLSGIFVGHREMAEDMNRAISLHQMKPVIDRTFTLQQSSEALAYMESGAHFGKIVVAI